MFLDWPEVSVQSSECRYQAVVLARLASLAHLEHLAKVLGTCIDCVKGVPSTTHKMGRVAVQYGFRHPARHTRKCREPCHLRDMVICNADEKISKDLLRSVRQ